MSAVDKYKKMIMEESEETQHVTNSERKSFQELRAETIDFLSSRLWLMKKECQFLDARTNAKTKENFDEKGKGWNYVIMGTEILKAKYK